MQQKAILIIDDDVDNTNIIRNRLKKLDFEMLVAHNGREGLDILEERYNDIAVIVLDRMMPVMNGMEVLKEVKSRAQMQDIAVLIQTAASDKEKMLESVKEGAFYYLVKPYNKDVLVSLVSAAYDEYLQRRKARDELEKQKSLQKFFTSCELKFNDIDDIDAIAGFLANLFPKDRSVVIGIKELLVNAVEHGNLGISYDEKTELNMTMRWHDEIKLRQRLPENIDKYVVVKCAKESEQVILSIIDEGDGFDWQKYITMSADRAFDNHGRGIAIANELAFDEIVYHGKGNHVDCIVHINPPKT